MPLCLYCFAFSTRPRKKGGHVQFNASHSDYEAGKTWSLLGRVRFSFGFAQVVAQAAEERGWRVVKCEEKVGRSEKLARGASNPNVHLLPTMLLSGYDVTA